MNKTNILPFVKWVGGKRQLLSKLVKKIPKNYNTYFEPFVGGGALFFAITPKKAIINDLNKELMDTYRAIRQDVNRLRENLLLMELGHKNAIELCGKNKKNSIFYNKIRAIDLRKEFEDRKLNMKDSIYLRAARFIYLNKNTFNGLYRVNKSGYFNSPSKHNKTQKTFNWEELVKVSKYLNTIPYANIKNKHFIEVALKSKKGDFIYFDPPYHYQEGTKGFKEYQKEGFGDKEQISLANLCNVLDKKGVKFMISNHNTNLINKLYSNFHIEIIKAKRNIGGKGASRNIVQEVLVTNYYEK